MDRIKTARLCLFVAGVLKVATAGLLLYIFIVGSIFVGWAGERSRLLGSGMLGALGIVLFLAMAAIGAADFIAASAIGRKKAWGRILGLVLGVIILPLVPVGTVLGIFVLAGLIGADAEAWFRQAGTGGTLRSVPSGPVTRSPLV